MLLIPFCIRQGLLDMVILLMSHGADPSLEDNEGKVNLTNKF